ncbi:hypothetical protein EV356DRAFT_557564 [Viridothelium virens]|uniref:Uncharacterized protein n=1 Tax=Viridothelium virens TaxID=1048519 RepID=A0A6A6HJM8_VIRVR|nr:hypothetical protein EV356DRAFT_557564 [Viridothelium virens]
MSPNLPASTSSSTLIPTKLVSRCQNCGKTHRPPCQACPECGKRHPPPCDPRFVARRSFYCDSKINNQAQKDPNVELPKPRFILDQHRNVQRPTSTTFSTTTEEASETSGTGAKPKSGSKMPFQRVCHTCGDHHHGPCFSGNFSLFCSPAGGGISPITATPTDSGALREFENKPPHMQSRNGKDSEEPGTRENSPLKPYSAASHGVDDLATSFLRSSLKHIGEEQYDNDSGSSSANIK